MHVNPRWCTFAVAVAVARPGAAQQLPPSDDPVGQSKPVVTPAPAADDKPRGWLGIANAEAARMQKVMRERIWSLLRNYNQKRDSSADHELGSLKAVMKFGSDAVPLLLDLLRGAGGGPDQALASPAARCLVGIYDSTKNGAFLKSLIELAKGGDVAVKSAALDGLEELDHPTVAELAATLVQENDPNLRAHAVRVLGRQKQSTEFAASLVRPLLQQPNAPLADAIAALHQLGDKEGVDQAQALLPKATDATLIVTTVRYLGDLGGRRAIPVLGNVLMRGPPGLNDATLKQVVDAVARIGLREIDAKPGAVDLLLECFNKHASRTVGDWARWQLGPYQNEVALKSLEDPLLNDIKANSKVGRSNTDCYIDLAEYRLRFEAWTKALDALKNAKDDDDRGLRRSYIETLRAVGLCGKGKFPDAEKILLELDADTRKELIAKYPVLEKMAKEAKYRDLFPDQ